AQESSFLTDRPRPGLATRPHLAGIVERALDCLAQRFRAGRSIERRAVLPVSGCDRQRDIRPGDATIFAARDARTCARRNDLFTDPARVPADLLERGRIGAGLLRAGHAGSTPAV